MTLSRLVNDKSDLRKSDNLRGIATALGIGEDVILYGPIDHYLNQEPGQSTVLSPMTGGSAAEQLLEFLSERLGHRRIAGELTDKDLIAAALSTARSLRRMT